MQLLQHGVVAHEAALLLVVIAGHHVLSQPHVAGGRPQLPQYYLKESGLSYAVGAHKADAVVLLYVQTHVLEQRRRSGVRKGQALREHHVVAGCQLLRKVYLKRLGEHYGLFQTFHVRKPLLPGLGALYQLFRAAALVAGDQLLLVLYLFLLLLVVLKVYLVLQLLLLLVGAVVAFVAGKVAALDLEYAGNALIQEIPVVRDYHKGAAVAGEVALQPLERLNVQVVGGLVQEHKVRFAQEHGAERQTGLFAAGKGAYHLPQALLGETEGRQNAAGRALKAVAVDVLETLRKGPSRQGALLRRVLLSQSHERVEYAAVVREVLALTQVAGRQVPCRGKFSAVRRQFAHYHLEKR